MADCCPIYIYVYILKDLLLLLLIAIFGTVQKLLGFLNENIMCLAKVQVTLTFFTSGTAFLLPLFISSNSIFSSNKITIFL